MTALTQAKQYLAKRAADGTQRTMHPEHPDVLLAELVAEIEGSPIVDVFKYRGSITIEPDDESLVGKRVRLLALDSGGAGEVG